MNKFNFGECWYIDLNPTKGHEQGELRSVIIISSDEFNGTGSMRLVVPISTDPKYGSDPKWEAYPWVLEVPRNEFGTSGYILANQVRSIDMSTKAKKKWGNFTKKELESLLDAVGFILPE